MFSLYDPCTLVQAFALSRQGSSHLRATPPKPCQDACGVFSGSFRGEGAMAVVVADGHGSAVHDHSDVGAQLAVQTAGELFLDFALRAVEVPPAGLVPLFRDHFPRRLVRRWREKVEGHAGEVSTTLTSRELIGANPPKPEDGELLWRRYGTTLLFAGFYRQYMFVVQLGDGAVVVQRADGTLEFPIPPDPSHFGGRTFSLSATDARDHCLVRVFSEEDTPAVMLCTDGVTDAYDKPEKMREMLRKILENRRSHGLGPATDLLPDFLDSVSTYGSGDDITVAGLVIHAVAVPVVVEEEVEQVEVVVEKVEVEKIEEEKIEEEKTTELVSSPSRSMSVPYIPHRKRIHESTLTTLPNSPKIPS